MQRLFLTIVLILMCLFTEATPTVLKPIDPDVDELYTDLDMSSNENSSLGDLVDGLSTNVPVALTTLSTGANSYNPPKDTLIMYVRVPIEAKNYFSYKGPKSLGFNEATTVYLDSMMNQRDTVLYNMLDNSLSQYIYSQKQLNVSLMSFLEEKETQQNSKAIAYLIMLGSIPLFLILFIIAHRRGWERLLVEMLGLILVAIIVLVLINVQSLLIYINI